MNKLFSVSLFLKKKTFRCPGFILKYLIIAIAAYGSAAIEFVKRVLTYFVL